MTERVAVFIDFQNAHLVGHGLFGGGSELYRCVPDPVRVADLIAARRGRPSEATAIRVYRGRPDPNHQPRVTASNDAQAAQWTRDRRVQVIRRQPVRFPNSDPPRPWCHSLSKADWQAVVDDWKGRP